MEERIKKEIRRIYNLYVKSKSDMKVKIMTDTDCYEEILKELVDTLVRPDKRMNRLVFQDFELTEAIIKDKILRE